MSRREDETQIAIVTWLRLKGLFVFHVPNQGGWSVGYQQKLTRMGRTAGIPDLVCVTEPSPALPRGLFCIEVKAPPVTLRDGSPSKAKPVLSREQAAAMADLARLGIPTIIARSIDDVEQALPTLRLPRQCGA